MSFRGGRWFPQGVFSHTRRFLTWLAGLAEARFFFPSLTYRCAARYESD